ncbi:MAG: LysM repeat protein [Flavobacteriaceae bacterium]|jgi:LysM repeat protein|tara:strand:- start:3626 stop:5545 length:1920 start_codon:yes stop_codon:yes gene_type:complete
MILAQNLLQQLNGNKMWYKIKYFLILFFVYGNVFSQMFHKQIIEKNQPIEIFLENNSITSHDFSVLNPNFIEKNLKIGDQIIIPKNQVSIIDENNYILHKVRRKQTLVKISNLYDVSLEMLVKYNNLSNDKLKKGSLIKIPTEALISYNSEIKNKVKYYRVLAKEGKWRVAYKYGITIDQLELMNPNINEFLQVSEKIVVPNIDFKNVNEIDENYAYYKVLPKEGFYRLKVKLGIEEEMIKSLNPILTNSELRDGMILKLPKEIDLKENLVTDREFNLVDFTKKKVALLLPIGINNINFDSVQITKSQLANDKLLNLSLDFYLGAITAIDSIASFGIPIELDVFDTNTSSKTDIFELVNKNMLQAYDLIVGPLTADAFNYTSVLLENKSSYLVSPLSKVNPGVNVINTITSDDILFEKIVSFVESDTIENKKFIISDSENLLSTNKLKQKFLNATTFFSTINDLGVDTKSLVLEDLDSTFVEGRNIVFLETRDQGFVSNVTSILNSFVDETHEILLFTTSAGKAFSGVNISNYYLSNLNFHYPSFKKPLDYDSNTIFISNFNNKYNFTPNKYVVRGYDLILDLLLRLSSDNATFNQDDSIESEYLENKFKYVRNTDSLGYKNISSYIIKYENLELKVID